MLFKCLFLSLHAAADLQAFICVGAASRVHLRPPSACPLREVVGGEKARLFMMELCSKDWVG